ncbi:MAG: hypothetical protein WAW31_06505 [Smithella sp.]
MHKIIDKLEQVFFRLFLYRRKKKIGADFNRALSLEIDCLQTLIDGKKHV